jgi:hypothetical protein
MQPAERAPLAETMQLKDALSQLEGPSRLAAHKVSLARDLLDDIELGRLNPAQMLLKASRLARLVDDEETREWLEFELKGYQDLPAAKAQMWRFGRWTDQAKNLGYWTPFAALGAWADAHQAEILQLRVPDVSVSFGAALRESAAFKISADAAAPVNTVVATLAQRAGSIGKLREIQSRVLAAVHDFASRTYYRLAFETAAKSVFEEHQAEIDKLLRAHAPDALEKIPAIVARLAEDDEEAISQAMNSCRRMIKAFADALQPASEDAADKDGLKYQLGSDKVLNRIEYFMVQRAGKGGRCERLKKNLRAIHDRASAGTHADVTADEAKALFLQTYLTLGEIIVACHDMPEAATPMPNPGLSRE